MELNKIYNQDCLVGIKEIKDKSVDVIMTDPPYLYLNHKLDRPFDENELFKEWDRVLKEDGFIVLFGRGESFHRWNYRLNQMGWKFKEEIIWDKRYISNPMHPLARCHETISILTKNGSLKKHKISYVESKKYDIDKIINDIKRIKSGLGNKKEFEEMQIFLQQGVAEMHDDNIKRKLDVEHNVTRKNCLRSVGILKSLVDGTNEKSIITVARDGRKSLIHPTQKPVRLIERLLLCVSKENDTVLDCFVGSGSTPIACINQKCNYIGFEIDKEYYELAKQRIDNHIKQLILM